MGVKDSGISFQVKGWVLRDQRLALGVWGLIFCHGSGCRGLGFKVQSFVRVYEVLIACILFNRALKGFYILIELTRL